MRRPWTVTLLALGAFVLAAVHLFQSAQAWEERDLLSSLSLSAPPAYWIVGGLFWGGLGLAAGVGLWRMRRWGWHLALSGALFYTLAWVCDRLLLVRSPEVRLGLAFDLWLHLAGLVGVLAILLGPRNADRFPRRGA
jgi:hypothetical protein